LPVSQVIKSKIHSIKIIIAADFDKAGIKDAIKCCEAGVVDSYILPEHHELEVKAEFTDWNDYSRKYGADKTRAALLKAIEKPIIPVKLDEQGDFNNPQTSDADMKISEQEPEHIIRVKCINANDLLRKELPPVKWTIEVILPTGLSLLGGSPKIGKSILSLHFSLAAALGGMALGKIPVERGSALYLALEDPERRLKDRLLNSGIKSDADLSKLDLVTEIPKQNGGGMDWIKKWLDAHSDARLVIIDTLQKFRTPKTKNGDIYAADYAAMEGLKLLADDYSVQFLVIHHNRKTSKDNSSVDWVDNFLGTTGLSGAADTLLSLTRARGQWQNMAIFKFTGRDVEERELALELNEFGWILKGDAAEFNLTEKERCIVNFLKEKGSKTPKEIADALGLNNHILRTELQRMADKGKLSKTGFSYFV